MSSPDHLMDLDRRLVRLGQADEKGGSPFDSGFSSVRNILADLRRVFSVSETGLKFAEVQPKGLGMAR